MAHFAKLGKGNIVEQVVVVSNDIATTEQAGVDFLNNLYKTRDVWKQTSYNATIRKNYASIGYKYDQARDAFIAPKPFNSWLFIEETCNWRPPVDYPETYTKNLTDEQGNPLKDRYYWNENKVNWELI
jgi:hypothetical protein